MVSKENIQKLSELARIEMSDSEMEKQALEMDSILDYVGQVNQVGGEYKDEVELGSVVNAWREDINPHEPGLYSKELIEEFPHKEKNYLKVKKIL